MLDLGIKMDCYLKSTHFYVGVFFYQFSLNKKWVAKSDALFTKIYVYFNLIKHICFVPTDLIRVCQALSSPTPPTPAWSSLGVRRRLNFSDIGLVVLQARPGQRDRNFNWKNKIFMQIKLATTFINIF